jgi:hypothetical protein
VPNGKIVLCERQLHHERDEREFSCREQCRQAGEAVTMFVLGGKPEDTYSRPGAFQLLPLFVSSDPVFPHAVA